MMSSLVEGYISNPLKTGTELLFFPHTGSGQRASRTHAHCTCTLLILATLIVRYMVGLGCHNVNHKNTGDVLKQTFSIGYRHLH